MPRHRTTARGIAFLLSLCGLAALVTGAQGAKPQLVFPVIGPVTYGDDFGDPRGTTGVHEGDDIMAPKRALAVAAEAGTVSFWTTSANAGCMLYLHGDSGTTYWYIHLNNDLTAANDNRGTCVAGVAYANGLEEGDRVAAGQPVGYVGDSGDADGLHAHLHFEVHPKGGRAVDPTPYLRKARPLLFWEPDATRFSLVLDGTVVAATADRLTLRVTLLREWPSHQRVAGLAQRVTLTVPEQTLAQPGAKVRIWTGLLDAGADMRAGLDGALSATRVLVL